MTVWWSSWIQKIFICSYKDWPINEPRLSAAEENTPVGAMQYCYRKRLNSWPAHGPPYTRGLHSILIFSPLFAELLRSFRRRSEIHNFLPLSLNFLKPVTS